MKKESFALALFAILQLGYPLSAQAGDNAAIIQSETYLQTRDYLMTDVNGVGFFLKSKEIDQIALRIASKPNPEKALKQLETAFATASPWTGLGDSGPFDSSQVGVASAYEKMMFVLRVVDSPVAEQAAILERFQKIKSSFPDRGLGQGNVGEKAYRRASNAAAFFAFDPQGWQNVEHLMSGGINKLEAIRLVKTGFAAIKPQVFLQTRDYLMTDVNGVGFFLKSKEIDHISLQIASKPNPAKALKQLEVAFATASPWAGLGDSGPFDSSQVGVTSAYEKMKFVLRVVDSPEGEQAAILERFQKIKSSFPEKGLGQENVGEKAYRIASNAAAFFAFDPQGWQNVENLVSGGINKLEAIRLVKSGIQASRAQALKNPSVDTGVRSCQDVFAAGSGL